MKLYLPSERMALIMLARVFAGAADGLFFKASLLGFLSKRFFKTNLVLPGYILSELLSSANPDAWLSENVAKFKDHIRYLGWTEVPAPPHTRTDALWFERQERDAIYGIWQKGETFTMQVVLG